MKRLAILLLCILPGTATAGAWTQPKGNIQLITSTTAYTALSYFDAKGKRQAQLPYEKGEFAAYAEYGLSNDITLGGQLALATIQQETLTGREKGYNLSDTEIFLRKHMWQGGTTVLSLQPSLTIPSPDKKRDVPKFGSDDLQAGLRGMVGKNFKLGKRWHYADAGAAYIHRLGSPADQLKFDVTIGLELNDRWQVIPQAFVTKSVKKVKPGRVTLSSADNYDLVKLQFSVQYKFSETKAMQLGAFSHVYGRNTGAGQGAVISYVRNF